MADVVMGQQQGQQIVDAQATSYVRVEVLQEKGVNVADIQKLKAAGFATTQSIVGVMRKEIINVKGIGEAKVDKIIEAAHKTMGEKSFFTCEELLVKYETGRFKVPTGSSGLDLLLRGGIESGILTELYGEYRSGKTQICHSLALQAQAMEDFAGRVLYLDTEGTFRPDRMKEIGDTLGFDKEAVMGNILVARCFTSEHLMKLLAEASVMMVESEEPFAIIIVDSIMGMFRQDYTGRGELAERQQALGRVLSRLQKMAEEFNCAVVYTNQVMADPSGGIGSSFAAPPKPIGGHVLAHASTVRMYCRKSKGDERIIKVVDSPSIPEGEATIQIYAGGIKNPDGM